MEKQDFIEYVASVAVKDWKERHIMLPSVVIAQACKESAFGTSELAVNAKAIFGIKKNDWTGKTYRKKADEQNPDGSMRTDENCLWRAYNNWEESIVDHNTYIRDRKVGNQTKPNFGDIVGETNVKKVIAGFVGNANRQATLPYCTDLELREYVKNGKSQYPYATGLGYPQSLYDLFIVKYNLTKYDNLDVPSEPENTPKMVINVHAGHNPDGKKASGAVGIFKESVENRKVKDKVIAYLKAQGHTVYDCTCEDGTSVSDVLNKIIDKCNAHTVDVDVSIHFNASNTNGHGVAVLIYGATSKSKTFAESTVNEIASLGFTNRGLKIRPDLSFLKRTKAPAMLVECCFCDNAEDAKLYDCDKMARAIVKGITGATVVTPEAESKPTTQYYPKYTGSSSSIAPALEAVGEKDSSKAHRIIIGEANGIYNVGTIVGNTQMLNLLKAGKLIKA